MSVRLFATYYLHHCLVVKCAETDGAYTPDAQALFFEVVVRTLFGILVLVPSEACTGLRSMTGVCTAECCLVFTVVWDHVERCNLSLLVAVPIIMLSLTC